ncbi:MAG: hypothetical protein G01um101470_158 [Parcubacteria group bacterium Gr01-1014_70]|nr:MAG: hypothetical protein G01um101470_158 [Parcubacteria group bacterium Gr01-1014_70]
MEIHECVSRATAAFMFIAAFGLGVFCTWFALGIAGAISKPIKEAGGEK